MIKPTLVIMAAGMGSRYGGLKQIDPIGPSGELILEYSVYDAMKSGFGDVIFIITEKIEKLFKEMVGDRIAREVPVSYVYQRLDDLPGTLSVPEGRTKPWGTAHAVYCCRHLLNGPFAVINADDFYGADAFSKTARFLREAQTDTIHHCCMVAYQLVNTMTENGYVARGACQVSHDGYLTGVTERVRIEFRGDGAAYSEDGGTTFLPIALDTPVSMNMWGFSARVVPDFEPMFEHFLTREGADLSKEEFFLPFVVNDFLQKGRADVKVLETDAKWYGVTYREDREAVKKSIDDMVNSGRYPERLWHHVG